MVGFWGVQGNMAKTHGGLPQPADLSLARLACSLTGALGQAKAESLAASTPSPAPCVPGGRAAGSGGSAGGTWGGPHVGQTPTPPPGPQGRGASYSPLWLGRWAQLLGPWERSSRDSRRVPRASLGESGRAGGTGAREPPPRPPAPGTSRLRLPLGPPRSPPTRDAEGLREEGNPNPALHDHGG